MSALNVIVWMSTSHAGIISNYKSEMSKCCILCLQNEEIRMRYHSRAVLVYDDDDVLA